MSSCRCGDKTSCKREIQRLDETLSMISGCGYLFQNINNCLSQISAKSRIAYDSTKTEEIATSIKSLDDDIISVKDNFMQKVNQKKSQLNQRLADLTREDDDYHEEQRRKAEEAARAAAEAAAAKNKIIG